LNYTIKTINASETYSVRQPVLRDGKPIETCMFDGDNLQTTFHLGLYITNELVGICSLFKNNHPLIANASQYQLRGMAILNTYQGLGLGTLILSHGETLLKQQGIPVIWCNARVKATEFYNKMGYKIIGEPFDIKDIGLHYCMYKPL
jgi:GNAT superfamily N-acetyltransferase